MGWSSLLSSSLLLLSFKVVGFCCCGGGGRVDRERVGDWERTVDGGAWVVDSPASVLASGML
jgi:hypothetical protein